jgi:NAD(P)-dependent dehydrogenase (short-subunit alcohol dehydrogenase family)
MGCYHSHRIDEQAEALCLCCRREVPGAKLEAQCIDLSDLESVRSFTQRALAFPGHQLDVLLNNAGDVHCTAHQSAR